MKIVSESKQTHDCLHLLKEINSNFRKTRLTTENSLIILNRYALLWLKNHLYKEALK